MKFLEDIVAARPTIEAAIQKWGYAAEHNFFWFQCYVDPGWRNIFIESEHGALFTSYNPKKQVYAVVFDPLAAPEQRIPLLLEYTDWIFKHTQAKKIWFQLETPVQQRLWQELPVEYHANKVYFSLVWPIYDMRDFDTALPGGHFKSIRKEMHRFYRDHAVTVRDAHAYPDAAALHAVVDHWRERRPNPEKALDGAYHQVIDNNFKGMDEARIFEVDGKPVGFNAGWNVPNSDRFYGAIGLHDYSIDGLGTMLYLEDLFYLKGHGYGEVDMAGSEKPLLWFKNKFCLPKRTYRTSHFSITRAQKPLALHLSEALQSN
ncbi:MAG: DUF2156 domain-containing protein [Patescibacteria group bacterium]|nr:DUF2156 domain-containing protein [Patescibacteria group bacterium]